jgi:nucleoside phosphorylase
MRPTLVLNVGLAGGLVASAAPGRCYATTSWVGDHAAPAAALPEGLRVRLRDIEIFDGVAATVDSPVGDRASREPLIAAGATMVEMEGGAWARSAGELRIPFAALRAISDRADNPLPRPRHELLAVDGSVRWKTWVDAVKTSGTPWPEAHRRLRRAQADWLAAVATLTRVGSAIREWIGH